MYLHGSHCHQKYRLIEHYFNEQWDIVIGVYILSFVLYKIADLGISLFCRELYIKQKKLLFPLAEIDLQTVREKT
ncbi:MAG: hypothetical protein DRJ64_00230 [Thermoprotei archaeon]|nr:MAG: hypothetical protein DRJ64_00230 [Thermoprotei archaeon]